MGVVIPQVVTASRATGAQVIDGSLKFDGTYSNKLTKTFASSGSRQSWTWSGWVKKQANARTIDQCLFGAYDADNDTDWFEFGFGGSSDHSPVDKFYWTTHSTTSGTTAILRDNSAWYHCLVTYDGSNIKVYINSSLELTSSKTGNLAINANFSHSIGMGPKSSSPRQLFASLSQVYFIDGQALDASYFGYTDGLTNTWKPKKYEGDFGTNGFYLPFDGSAPIGQDQSGQGNNWTPVNFGGSVELDSPLVTGARPILNTTQGGTQAGVGVFGSKQNVGYAVTVYNDGGGNKYYIDGVKQDTVTGLIRGATYTFDTSDSTVSSHPFRFSATSNGSHGGGSEYTNGVAAITGAATTITVPYDAPETLYYYCTSHSGMGADITGITTNEKLADQYASHCVLAVPFISGVSDDVSPSIACTSTKKTLTKQGDPTSSTSSNFYSSSTDFDGTGDYYTSGSETAFTFGTGDFTVEFWVESDDLGGSNQDGYLQISDTSGGLKTGYANGFAIYEGANAGTVNTAGVSASIPSTGRLIKAGVWNHIALVREGTSVRLYANGFLAGSGTSSKDMTASYLALGGYYSTSYVYNGRLQDFRIYKGVAKYNGSFEVPVTSPYILPDTPSGVSGGSKLTKITDGAVAFDGTSDALRVSDHADLRFGTGAFTVECYVYFHSFDDTYPSIISKYTGDTVSWIMRVKNNGKVVYYDGGGSNNESSSEPIVLKKWHHLAMVREGTGSNQAKMYVDGKLVITVTDNTDYTDTQEITIGAQNASNSNVLNGFMSNVRILKGTALYTSNFIPPTAPLTNVTNTKLLCCQSNTSATEAAVTPGSITAAGDAAATTFNPFNTDINTVRGQETGYATLNPLFRSGTYSDGNLVQTTTAGNGHYRATIGITTSSGKFYFEYQPTGSNVPGMVGFAEEGHAATNNLNGASAYSYYGTTGYKQGSPSAVDSAYGATFTFGDVIGVAFDSDNGGSLEYFKNGVSQGVAFSNEFPNFPYYPAFSAGSSSNTTTYNVNFGQKPFKFPPPDGFQPLNAANTRPVKVISRPDQYVGVTTYAGDGSSSGRHINIGFRPDLIWLKSRGSGNNGLYDSVRGPDKRLQSDSTAVEGTVVFPGASNFGFDFGSETYYNASSTNYVAWTWKAGGNKNTFNVDDVGYATAAAAGLTGGDITPTGASVGTKQGFSIIEFTGSGSGTPSISHGLSEAPNFIVQKDTGATTSWRVFMYNGTTWGIMNFDDASGVTSASETAPTSSLFYANGNGNAANTQIAYLWHDVPGLQKFGTFEGNGNANGPFIELGFRPSLILMRNLDNYGTNYDWCIYDNERAKFNPDDVFQCINLAKADNVRGDNTADNSRDVDFLSNGFKIRNTASTLNLSSHTIFYAAWAEAPSVDLFGGGANAR